MMKVMGGGVADGGDKDNKSDLNYYLFISCNQIK